MAAQMPSGDKEKNWEANNNSRRAAAAQKPRVLVTMKATPGKSGELDTWVQVINTWQVMRMMQKKVSGLVSQFLNITFVVRHLLGVVLFILSSQQAHMLEEINSPSTNEQVKVTPVMTLQSQIWQVFHWAVLLCLVL